MDKRFSPAVIAAAQAGRSAYRVPSSVTLAQWALESRYGEAMPKGSNNPFGIKAKAGEPFVEAMTWEVEHGVRVNKAQRFRKFDTLAAAFEAHARLLATSRYYVKAMLHCDRPDAFANALTGVYATDPAYGSKLISIMKANNLYAFDHDVSLSAAGPAAAKPSAAPVAAAPAPSVATPKAPTMLNLNSITALITLAQAGIHLGTEYAAAAPQLVENGKELVKDGKDAANAIGELASDIKGGRYSETPEDIKAILSKFGEIIGDVSRLVDPAARIVSKAGALPTVAGIKALGKAA